MELDRAVRVLGPATLLLTFLGLAWAVQAADTCPGKGTPGPLVGNFSFLKAGSFVIGGFLASRPCTRPCGASSSKTAALHTSSYGNKCRGPEWIWHLRNGASSACRPIMETEAGFHPPWATCPSLSVKSAVTVLCGEGGLVVPAGQTPVRYSAMITITERQGVRRG